MIMRKCFQSKLLVIVATATVTFTVGDFLIGYSSQKEMEHVQDIEMHLLEPVSGNEPNRSNLRLATIRDLAMRRSRLEDIELQIFNQQKRKPVELLHDFYESSQILALGEVTYLNHTALLYLEGLLNLIKNDDRFRYLVMEWDPDDYKFQAFFDQYADLVEVEKDFNIPGGRSLIAERYFSGLNSSAGGHLPFFWHRIVPLLAEINKSRPEDRKIKIVGIKGDNVRYVEDDTRSQGRRSKKDSESHSSKRLLSIVNFNFGGLFASEKDKTLENFETNVVSRIEGTDDKAIVVYHIGGLLRNFLPGSSMRMMTRSLRHRPSSWMDGFFESESRLKYKTKVVAFDEAEESYCEKESKWVGYGVFKLSKRLANFEERGVAYGLSLKPFFEALDRRGQLRFTSDVGRSETGREVTIGGRDEFEGKSYFSRLDIADVEDDNAPLFLMIDGLIWTPYPARGGPYYGAVVFPDFVKKHLKSQNPSCWMEVVDYYDDRSMRHVRPL